MLNVNECSEIGCVALLCGLEDPCCELWMNNVKLIVDENNLSSF